MCINKIIILITLLFTFAHSEVTYFGNNVDGTLSSDMAGYTVTNKFAKWTCPGTGTQNVVELSARVWYTGGTVNHIRVAMYSLDGSTKLCEGVDEVDLPASVAWTGHGPAMSNALSPSVPTIVGGTDCLLVVTFDGSGATSWIRYSTDDSAGYVSSEYTGGFPSSLPAQNNFNDYNFCIRAGVEPASACTPATVTKATVAACTSHYAHKWWHSVSGTYDSLRIRQVNGHSVTAADSISLVAGTDTVRWVPQFRKSTPTDILLKVFDCDDSVDVHDTVTSIVWDSIQYRFLDVKIEGVFGALSNGDTIYRSDTLRDRFTARGTRAFSEKIIGSVTCSKIDSTDTSLTYIVPSSLSAGYYGPFEMEDTVSIDTLADPDSLYLVASIRGAATYTVTYNGNTNTGGSPPTDANEYEEGATVTTLGNTGNLVKSGYTFNDWNTAANGSGTARISGGTWSMPAANVTLYAQWTANPDSFDIEIQTTGTGLGTYSLTPNLTRVETGTEIILRAFPTAGSYWLSDDTIADTPYVFTVVRDTGLLVRFELKPTPSITNFAPNPNYTNDSSSCYGTGFTASGSMRNIELGESIIPYYWSSTQIDFKTGVAWPRATYRIEITNSFGIKDTSRLRIVQPRSK